MKKLAQHLIFDISPLAQAPAGTKEVYSFDVPIKMEDIAAKSNLKGQVEIMRIEKGLNVMLKNLEIEVSFTCMRCLKNFTQPIRIKSAERHFHFDHPKHVEDPEDLFLVNKKNLTVDVSQPLRQEIILHFPSVPVCSMHCKGICAHCGKNRNTKECNCKDENPHEHKPLAGLKDLIKKHG